MAFSRQLGVLGILGASFFVAIGCGDDDDKKAPSLGDAGEAGENGSGGTSQGGSSNTAGSGGTSAGTAGSATAGMATDAGAAGEGGGGAVAGMGGEGGTTIAGAAGGGGEGGSQAAFPKCTASCERDNDCAIDGAPPQKCDLATHHCFNPLERCEIAADCAPGLTFFFPCETAQNCIDSGFAGDQCVEWQGSGYCAIGAAGADAGCSVGKPQSFPVFGGQGNTVVCMNDTGRCSSNGECFVACDADSCDDKGTCDDDSGLCVCDDAADCGNGVCGPDSQCAECVTSEDCANNLAGNLACIDGKCGCDSADNCADYGWAQAMPVCE